MKIPEEDYKIWKSWEKDWNKFAEEALGVNLDKDQKEILTAVQHNRRVSVRSGTARGKDYVAAVACICFLYLNSPSKVICTAPTGRQVTAIMMAEISKIHRNAPINKTKYPLNGRLLTDRIVFKEDDTWFLMGFKADDKSTESWSGFHSPNLMVVGTEATGFATETVDAIEGILQGNSKLLWVFNPNRNTGEAAKSINDPQYVKFRLNDLSAPNVVNYQKVINGEITETEYKKLHIPGQVDYAWIKEKVEKPSWATAISKKEVRKDLYDFKWEGQWYRPSDLFRVKVLGEFPAESEDQLIPLSWIEMANERWRALNGKGEGKISYGCDVAGEGRDKTAITKRVGNIIEGIKCYPKMTHMQTAGKVKNLLQDGGIAFIDTIGEGAGVYSRLVEMGEKAVSVKGSFVEIIKGLTDLTGEREFVNMRAYLHWAFRDALDPNFGIGLALPPDDELTEEATAIKWEWRSNGKIIIEEKEEMKKRIKRSPDKLDAVLTTFFPDFGIDCIDLGEIDN